MKEFPYYIRVDSIVNALACLSLSSSYQFGAFILLHHASQTTIHHLQGSR